MALRQCVVLTDIGFHINEIVTKLRAYDIDRANLASIADKRKQVEATAQTQSILLDSTALHRHPSKSRHRLPFLQRHGLLLIHLQPVLDSTKQLRKKAAAFVADQASFSWRHTTGPVIQTDVITSK